MSSPLPPSYFWPDEFRDYEPFLSVAFHPHAYVEVRNFLLSIEGEQMTPPERFINDLFSRDAVESRDELRSNLIYRPCDSPTPSGYPFSGGLRESFVDAALLHWQVIEQGLGIPADVVLSSSAYAWASHWVLMAREPFLYTPTEAPLVATVDVSFVDYLADAGSREQLHHGTTFNAAHRINRTGAGLRWRAAHAHGDFNNLDFALYFSSSRRFALAWSLFKQPFEAWFGGSSKVTSVHAYVITIERPPDPPAGVDQTELARMDRTELPDSPEVQAWIANTRKPFRERNRALKAPPGRAALWHGRFDMIFGPFPLAFRQTPPSHSFSGSADPLASMQQVALMTEEACLWATEHILSIEVVTVSAKDLHL